MKTVRLVLILVVVLCASATFAQQAAAPAQPAPNTPAEDISGMYSFLREGEFVQVTVEDSVVSGFVSRYGDSDSDKGSFLDQFFSKASLNGSHLTFTTKKVHGSWFDFEGTVERGPGKTAHDEAYRVIKGTLTQSSEDADKKVSSKSRQIEMKSFPQDLDNDIPHQNP